MRADVGGRAAVAAALLLACLSVGGRLTAAAAWEGRLAGLGGETLSEADLARGTTIVVVWATWSPKSRDVVARTNRLVESWGARARVITVDFQEERPEVERFLAGKGLRAPVFLDSDGSFSKHYAVATLPGLLVVRDGEIAYQGKLPDDADGVVRESLDG